jgi:hypothetical protein
VETPGRLKSCAVTGWTEDASGFGEVEAGRERSKNVIESGTTFCKLIDFGNRLK